jgi:small subunit ribosomal protein S21
MTMSQRDSKVKGSIVYVKEGEDVNRALRRFKKKIEESGLLDTLRKKESYEKPTTERKRKKAAAKQRYAKKLQKEQLPKKLF